MSQQIKYTFLGDFLTPYGITVEDIAYANSYPPVVAKDASELPAQIETTRLNPISGVEETIQTYPDGTEFDKPNPETPLMYVAKMMPVVGMETMIMRVMSGKIQALREQIRELERQPRMIAEAYAAQAIEEVIE